MSLSNSLSTISGQTFLMLFCHLSIQNHFSIIREMTYLTINAITKRVRVASPGTHLITKPTPRPTQQTRRFLPSYLTASLATSPPLEGYNIHKFRPVCILRRWWPWLCSGGYLALCIYYYYWDPGKGTKGEYRCNWYRPKQTHLDWHTWMWKEMKKARVEWEELTR